MPPTRNLLPKILSRIVINSQNKNIVKMKSVFIAYDKALHDFVIEALNSSLCKGYTLIPEAAGRGSVTGEPHLGSHAWPSTNSAIITVTKDEQVEPLFNRLRKIDKDNPLLGLRAFVWNVEQSI